MEIPFDPVLPTRDGVSPVKRYVRWGWSRNGLSVSNCSNVCLSSTLPLLIVLSTSRSLSITAFDNFLVEGVEINDAYEYRLRSKGKRKRKSGRFFCTVGTRVSNFLPLR